MAEFIWAPEGPPPSLTPTRAKYDRILIEISSRPNEWARIPVKTRSAADSLRKRINSGQIPGKWESLVRRIGEEFWVFVRYVGEE